MVTARTVKLMRFVDYYVGRPLCFVLSVFVFVERLFGLRRVKKGFRPRKVLFIELSEMGSAIVAHSAMEKVKELFDAQLYFMIFEENEASVRVLGSVPDVNVITIRSSCFLSLFVDTLKAVVTVRRRKIDTVIDLEMFSRFTALLSFLSGARTVVGFHGYQMEGLYRGNFLTHRVECNPHQHMGQNFLALAYALEADPDEEPMLKRKIGRDEIKPVRLPPEDPDGVMRKLQEINPGIADGSPIVVLNPNSSQLLPIRRWPMPKFIELAQRILETGAFIVITGTASEGEDAKTICEALRDERCIDFTGKTSLRELIDLYHVSSVIVTNDSGPAHFASLTGIKIVVLFGPETPDVYGPLSDNCTCITSRYSCSPCVNSFNHRQTPCTDSKCLSAITVDEVLEAVSDGLRRG